ncbi:Lrp/AsnC family transcriptional regulator [Brevundimonas bacteroides]|uniref:Lrp/AsnC family transcriptional regulator n=1 Tax=Brevundimonas bacteroides TaxID=74311 RepID=UPI0004962967|nr:Lrp/AsnC family transcriptional regulator [Brevundimonas bacteroides]
MPPVLVDVLDGRLLMELQRNSRIGVAELCDTVGLTPATCHRRLKRLRESGLIVGEVALVDPRHTARPLTVIIELKLDQRSGGERLAFERRLAEQPELSMAWAVSGDTDFVAIGQFRDIEHYRDFMLRQLIADDLVQRHKSTLALERLRFDLSLEFAIER